MTWLTWVAARPDGELLAVGDADGRLRIWSPAAGRVVARQDLGARVMRAEWTKTAPRLLAIAEGGELFVSSADGSTLEEKIDTRHGIVSGLSVHPSRPWAATTGVDGFLRVWDLSLTPAKLALEVKEASEGTVTAISETHVAAGFRSGQFVVWELATGKDIAGGPIFGAYVSALAFSPDGASLVCGGGKGGLVAIAAATWSARETWPSTPPKPIATNAIEFAADGRFVCAHSDDTASLFGPGDRVPTSLGDAFWLRRKPWEQQYIVSAACFVPKTNLLMTSHFTGRLRVWQEESIESVRLVDRVAEVAFDAATDAVSVLGRAPSAGAPW